MDSEKYIGLDKKHFGIIRDQALQFTNGYSLLRSFGIDEYRGEHSRFTAGDTRLPSPTSREGKPDLSGLPRCSAARLFRRSSRFTSATSSTRAKTLNCS
jgi:hypothetical protein